jgi:prepilin-type N-terminal cleavage/methylation domain-containing protein
MREGASSERGFTLMELLVVVTIVGVLATVVTFSVVGLGEASGDAACGNEGAALKAAEDSAIANEGHFLTEAQLVSSGYLKQAVAAYDVESRSDGGYQVVQVGSCSVELAGAGGGGGGGGGPTTTSSSTTTSSTTTSTSTTTTSTTTTSTTTTSTTTTTIAPTVTVNIENTTNNKVRVFGTASASGSVTVKIYDGPGCTNLRKTVTVTPSAGSYTTGSINVANGKRWASATQGSTTSACAGPVDA